MNRYLVEVRETISHMVTVAADDEQQAQALAMAFVCVEVERLAPEYQCAAVKPLQEVSAAGGTDAPAD